MNGENIVNGHWYKDVQGALEDSPFPSTDNANLSSLVDLIKTSVSDILSQYEDVGACIPSLDSTDPSAGSFGSTESSTPQLRRAVRIVQAACGQLCASIADPVNALFASSMAIHINAGLGVAVGAKIADHLAENPEGLSSSELCDKTGIDAGKLGRILRLLSTRHIFREKEPDVFVNNRLSMRLRFEDPNSAYLQFLTDESFKAAPYVFDTISDSSIPPSTAVYENVFKRNIWKYYETEEGREKREKFARAMVGYGAIMGTRTLVTGYPWKSIPASKPTTICDVGGGNGSVMLTLLRAFPGKQFKTIVQDLPGVVGTGKKFWEEKFPEALAANRVDFIPIDFLKEGPVAGCDFYYMRNITHDWPDEQCEVILRNVAQAMRAKPKTSRLLLHGYVLHSATSAKVGATENSSSGVESAPHPLLSNFGMASGTKYDMDLHMMVIFGSKERTLDESLKLASLCGLELQHEWDAGEASILEFSLALGDVPISNGTTDSYLEE